MKEQLKSIQDICNARPILKWAGGKSKLFFEIQSKFPKDFGSKIRKYAEPFFGGGAVFFELYNAGFLDSALISDSNIELILLYQTIQKSPDDLINELFNIEKKYLNLNIEQRKQYYYDIRDMFNASKKDEYLAIDPIRASHIIFLNRTCFNGLYRVNSKGKFNVPQGDYKNPTICDTDNIYQVSNALQIAEITYNDFSYLMHVVNDGYLIYYDPPYKPISKTSSFTAYDGEFGDNEQINLKNIFKSLTNEGVHQILSNSDPKSAVGDDFFDELYLGFNIYRVEAARMINSNASKRGKISELLITNYD